MSIILCLRRRDPAGAPVKGVAAARTEATFRPRHYAATPAAARTCTSACSMRRSGSIFEAMTQQAVIDCGTLSVASPRRHHERPIVIPAPTAEFVPPLPARRPTVPLNPSWSVNNRGVAFRVPHGPRASRARSAPHRRRRCQPDLLCYRACAYSSGLTRKPRSGPRAGTGNAYRVHDTEDDSAVLARRRSVCSSAANSAGILARASRTSDAQTRRGEMQDFIPGRAGDRLRLVP